MTTPKPQWRAQNLRLTIFPASTAFDMETLLKIWRAVSGAETAELTTAQIPLATYLVQGSPSRESEMAGTLTASASPGRLDVILSAQQTPSDTEPASLGIIEKTIGTFVSRLHLFFEHLCPPVLRVAVGSVSIIPTANRVDGYDQLQKFLPDLKVDSQNSSDLVYQINRPRSSRVTQSLQLNRITRWTVQVQTSVSISIGGSSEGQNVVQHFAARLETDFSTNQQNRTVVAKEHLARLVDELKEMTVEASLEGDIP